MRPSPALNGRVDAGAPLWLARPGIAEPTLDAISATRTTTLVGLAVLSIPLPLGLIAPFLANRALLALL